MGFINETNKLLGIDKTLKNQTFCNVAPNYGVVIEGYKKIYELSKTKIVLICNDGKKVEIIGSNLIIKEVSFSELSVNGTISTLNFS